MSKLTLKEILIILKEVEKKHEYYYIQACHLEEGVIEELNEMTFVRFVPSYNNIVSIDTGISFGSLPENIRPD